MSSLIRYSKERVESTIEVIKRLKLIDFPYDHSKNALEKVDEVFRQLQTDLENTTASKDQALAAQLSTRILEQVWRFLPILGFILRSTNVRNAFEVHGPLLRLSRALLGKDTMLLVSSEWNYSPYTFRPIPFLHEFVFLGLPATESPNPLLIPLAGHELGHSLWIQEDLQQYFQDSVRDAVVNYISQQRWGEFKTLFPGTSEKPELFGTSVFDLPYIGSALNWSICQIEESFCDFVGLRLFGTSFLNAFAYLLAPGISSRTEAYPTLKTRALNLDIASRKYGVDIPTDFASNFVERAIPASWSERDRYLVGVADYVTGLQVSAAIELVNTVVGRQPVELPDSGLANTIQSKFFEQAVPSHGITGLANILNAGWALFAQENQWEDKPNLQNKRACLKDIILKSIEILEYEQRVSSTL